MLASTARRQILGSPVCVTGFPRSEAPLMLSLLDSHPDLLVLPRETHFFDAILPCFRRDPAKAAPLLAHGSVTPQLGRRFWIEKTPFNQPYAIPLCLGQPVLTKLGMRGYNSSLGRQRPLP